MSIKVRGERVLERSVEELWDMLLDPAILKRCIPGCETLEAAGEHSYRVTLSARLGLIRGKFHGQVELRDVRPLESYLLIFDGSGRTGSINGRTSIQLTRLDDEKRTKLGYVGESRFGGKIALVGGRFFQGFAVSYVERFFETLAKI